MTDPVLVVRPDDVARKLGLKQPLDEDVLWLVEQAVSDAQADVEAYLGRPVTVREFTQSGVWPAYGDQWVLDQDPVVSIVSYTPEVNPVTGLPSGMWTVVYTAGLDGAGSPELQPVRRYVAVHAFFAPEVQAMYRRVAPELARVVEQVTVEGQTVRYNRTFATSDVPGSGAPGTLPTLASLDKWRVAKRRVFQRPTPPGAAEPWPYDWTYPPGGPAGSPYPGPWPTPPPGWGWG